MKERKKTQFSAGSSVNEYSAAAPESNLGSNEVNIEAIL